MHGGVGDKMGVDMINEEMFNRTNIELQVRSNGCGSWASVCN